MFALQVGQFSTGQVGQFSTGANRCDGNTLRFFDHLDAPIVQTDATGVISYQADYEPYSKIFALRRTTSPHQPIRLPGQTAERFSVGVNGLAVGVETDLVYNNARWYRPEWGQYAESDLFGVISSPRLYERTHIHKLIKVHALKELDSASTALYSYGSNSPITTVDATGLIPFKLKVWGNYCGPGYTAGKYIPTAALTYDQWKNLSDTVPPFDALDRCCEDHDGKYEKAANTSSCGNYDRDIADFGLAQCAARVMQAILDGKENDPNNPAHTFYEYLAA